MNTKLKSNALSVVTTTLTSQGAKVTTTSEKASLTMTEMLDLVHDAGFEVIAYKGADEVKVKALESLNTKGKALHNGGTRLADGRSKDKQTATLKQAFLDSMGDLKPSYKQNCYELFAKLVNTGKEIKDLNKTKNKAKNGEAKDEPKFESLLVKLECHSQLVEMSEEFQAELRDKLAELGYEIS
jgi:hypothetical protein